MSQNKMMQTKTINEVYGIQSLFVKQDRGGFLKLKKNDLVLKNIVLFVTIM